MKTKTWQSILAGERQSSSIIKEEIRNLTDSGKELEASLPKLEKTLGEARKSLLAEVPGSLERVQEAEGAISECTNRLAGLSSILQELDAALKEALASERKNRLAEIITETASIDGQMAEIRLEIVEHFAKAAALYKGITGQEYYRLSNDFFENYKLTDKLRECIAKNSSDGLSLFQQRRVLESEGIQLRKKSIS